ncbi:MAG TPA: DUF5996 family protein [Steroidobacteraceae bacterium]|jgi:hypothetical protein|nr:DUF5996 family protein [Steroidobacteraceae bacterium]
MPKPPLAPWPELPLPDWRSTYATLHMWAQIVGKTRLALAPMENHWWQVALYVSARGLTTSPMPFGNAALEIEFDFISHQLLIQLSDGAARSLPLASMTVADFYARYLHTLHELGVKPAIYPSPVEVQTAIPFPQDREHATYHPQAARQCWLIFLNTERVMKRFRGRFLGKQSPVHFFWGSFDLAATRFSGRAAPPHPGGVPHCPDGVMIEAYSHECSSCGFWPGDENSMPLFYSYAYPEPPGYAERRLESPARYDMTLREFVLPYDALRSSTAPDELLLGFYQTTYETAADLGRWGRAMLERPAMTP